MATLAVRLADLITAIGTDWKNFNTKIGNLASLTTSTQVSLVAAINEVQSEVGGGAAPDASETVKGIAELATLAEVATGTDTTRIVTAAGVRQERVALKAEILGAGVPAALDTLDELAAALGDDVNYAASTTTALGNRLRFDAAQTLTAPQKVQGKANLDAYGNLEIGNPDADLVALYTTAKA